MSFVAKCLRFRFEAPGIRPGEAFVNIVTR